MKKVQILGTGCPKCKQLAENAETAARELGIECEVEKVTDINEIMAFGVMMTPALAVDGEVQSSGKLLSPDQIKALVGGNATRDHQQNAPARESAACFPMRCHLSWLQEVIRRHRAACSRSDALSEFHRRQRAPVLEPADRRFGGIHEGGKLPRGFPT